MSDCVLCMCVCLCMHARLAMHTRVCVCVYMWSWYFYSLNVVVFIYMLYISVLNVHILYASMLCFLIKFQKKYLQKKNFKVLFKASGLVLTRQPCGNLSFKFIFTFPAHLTNLFQNIFGKGSIGISECSLHFKIIHSGRNYFA